MMGFNKENVEEMAPGILATVNQFLDPIYERFKILSENQVRMDRKLNYIIEKMNGDETNDRADGNTLSEVRENTDK